MLKRFLSWIALKEQLHGKDHKAPYVSEGDIWWASIGENVGSEINGKSKLFSRPVVILKKLSHGFYFVVPTTTQNRAGSWFVGFRQQERTMAACLHQARAIDYRRLSSKLGTIDDEDFTRVKDGFRALIK
jgi:mRNA interferase MazF